MKIIIDYPIQYDTKRYNKQKGKIVMIKCKDCKQDTPFDYMFNDSVCLDCVDEESLDLFRDADMMIKDGDCEAQDV